MLYPPHAVYVSFPVFWLTALTIKSTMSLVRPEPYVWCLVANIILYALLFRFFAKSWKWKTAGVAIFVLSCGISGMYVLALMALASG